MEFISSIELTLLKQPKTVKVRERESCGEREMCVGVSNTNKAGVLCRQGIPGAGTPHSKARRHPSQRESQKKYFCSTALSPDYGAARYIVFLQISNLQAET